MGFFAIFCQEQENLSQQHVFSEDMFINALRKELSLSMWMTNGRASITARFVKSHTTSPDYQCGY